MGGQNHLTFSRGGHIGLKKLPFSEAVLEPIFVRSNVHIAPALGTPLSFWKGNSQRKFTISMVIFLAHVSLL